MNTAYKHEVVLANNLFADCAKGAPEIKYCWENHLIIEEKCTEITLEIRENDYLLFSEIFTEYYYSNEEILSTFAKNGFEANFVCDGETFYPVQAESQRLLIVARRKI